MEFTLFSVLALGFILGIKHAIEPDHVIAVSTIASESKKLWQASLAGVFWGIGHTATLFIIGLILIIFKNDISDKWSLSLEFLVGIMLVYLGLASILSIKKRKKHIHQHSDNQESTSFSKKRSYFRSLIIGLIHGLAGSGAMVLLTMSTVHTVWQGALFIIVFGVGTIAGMLMFTTVIGIPFVISKKRVETRYTLILTTGAISAVFGIYYMYDLGVNEGLFHLWM
ncbi:sulfite exporter TauE/SafE family protein [Bacillus sp. FJAT-29790]|uniref:urease accessory protein UreH domain-containing protein n=1 Tax=Bacillus sp. FJAT-29790 TaxID=1895002 RepID=UPI001C22EF15|nr:sulfite exporter TauE/SafE family protein [Bacillus sp. FJAT-29790]MBU8880696.1 sulfite exporter TauE/SafE family protein [Bacillus sp. FJAT-29790]